MNEYDQQAKDFLDCTSTTIDIEFIKHDYHFIDDTDTRDVYKITLKRGRREYSFNFGQSLAKSVNPKNWLSSNKRVSPTPYDALSCLSGYSPGPFFDFCADYGYDVDSIKAKRVYDNVVDEYFNLQKLYSESELEQLQEIF